jgi:hypothetical protein
VHGAQVLVVIYASRQSHWQQQMVVWVAVTIESSGGKIEMMTLKNVMMR